MASELLCILLIAFIPAVILDPVEQLKVSLPCINCIEHVLNAPNRCDEHSCGWFGISQEYWIGGGSRTIRIDEPSLKYAFENCANDKLCSYLTINSYMSKYAFDCTNDGQVDCQDYFMIQKYGPTGCKTFTGTFSNEINQCLYPKQVHQ